MKECINNKKRIATIIGVTALPIAAMFNINQNWNDIGMIDVTLANIEALANPEQTGYCSSRQTYCAGGYTICCWEHTTVLYKGG